MDSNLLQRLLNGSEEENIKFLGDQPTQSPEYAMAKEALEIRHRQRINRPEKEARSFRKTLWNLIKILWVPIVVISTAIGIWNKEFWTFVSNIWHAVIR